MTPSALRPELVLIYFVYGLAFFSMGMALILETGRSPILVERRILRPLAWFGLLHGMHEWMEIIILQGVWAGTPFADGYSWFRVAWLAFSFIPLVAFGAFALKPSQQKWPSRMVIGVSLVVIYLLMVYFHPSDDIQNQIQRADALARYILAIPGGILAGVFLFQRSVAVRNGDHMKSAAHFKWAAVGFAVYGLTQIFVVRVDLFPAIYVNSTLFQSVFGFPVQILRATLAVLITVNLIQVIQIAEKERDSILLSAQQARMEALERLRVESEAREIMRKELLRHTVIAQEDERARVARELHDETAQLLTALSLSLATLKSSLKRTPQISDTIDQLQSLNKQMSQGIYRLVHDLRPAQLDDLGLVPALQFLAEQEKRRAGIQVNLEIGGEARRLEPLVETVIFRIAQEAITNVGRHASIDSATIRLEFGFGNAILEIKDEGVGFDPSLEQIPPHGWGLAGMRERAESVSGQISIDSAPGRGTCIRVIIPVSEPIELQLEENGHGSGNPANVGR